MQPAFFVLHHEGKPFVKSSPSDAWGSLLASLHPGSVHAEMVVTNLDVKATVRVMHEERRYDGKEVTHAIRRLNVQPVPVRMNPTRTSCRARARRVNLSYLS